MSRQPREEGVGDDREWAFDAVDAVSRTFALSIDLLAEPMASWVCTGYLVCRIADTVEDEPTIPLDVRADLLETYDEALDPDAETDAADFVAATREFRPADGGADWRVLDETERVFNLAQSFDPPVWEAMSSVGREMAIGMAEFLREYDDEEGLRLETIEELEDYCWYVAGTVGELFTRLLSAADVEWQEYPDPDDARSFALLLQLVNVAKDVGSDRETEDNVYLPGEWLAAEGVEHADVGRREDEAVAQVVERVADHAADYADGARRYIRTLPEDEGGVLEAAATPYLLALGTLREVRTAPVDAVEGTATVKIDREEVETLYRLMDRGTTQEEIDRLAAEIREGDVSAPDR